MEIPVQFVIPKLKQNCSCLGVTATPYYLQKAYVVRVVPDEEPLFVQILTQGETEVHMYVSVLSGRVFVQLAEII